MIKHKDLIIALANSAKIECYCNMWRDWMPLEEMRDSALQTFLGFKSDPDWSFRIVQENNEN